MRIFVRCFVTHSLKRSKQIADKKNQKLSEIRLKFTIVLIQRETLSLWSNFKLLSIVNQMKKTKCFAGDFIDNQRIFKILCPKPWSTEEFVRKCKLFVFNISTDNSIEESLAWIIFPEICLDKCWKLTEIFYFYQIDTGIKIFNNKNCKVTFGFEYICFVFSFNRFYLVYKGV